MADGGDDADEESEEVEEGLPVGGKDDVDDDGKEGEIDEGARSGK